MIISSNIVIIIVAFAVAVVAIYILYSIILFQGNGKKEEFQLTTKNILEHVKNLYDNKEYALVELLATNYLDRSPKNTDVRIYLAKAYFEGKKYNSAMKQCVEILKCKPFDLDTHFLLGKCYARKDFLSKAIKEYEFVTDRDKTNKVALQLLAKLYDETEQYFMAISAYEALVELASGDEENAEFQSILAELNERTHNYPAAFEAYKTRLGIYPKDIETNKKLAELYIKIGNYAVAIETLQYMLSFVIEPKTLLWIYDMLISLYEEVGEFENAIDYSERMLEIQGSDKFKIKNKIANFNIKLGRMEEGILILEDLVLLSQSGFDITLELAAAYAESKEYQKALDKYLVLLNKAQPKEAKKVSFLICELYIKWAIEYSEKEDYIRVFELLKNAVQYNMINPEIYYNMALNHFKQNHFNEAIENLDKALDYDKDKRLHAKSFLLLADCHHSLNNFFEETKAINDLLKLDDKNAEGLYRAGLMYVSQHDVKRAEEAFLKALLYNPDLNNAKYNLALIYENNNRDKAKELYMEILENDPTFVEAKDALADLSATDY